MSIAYPNRQETTTPSELPGQPRKRVGRAGPWELLTRLGEGVMARVYAARPLAARRGIGPAYAVKVLRRRWHDDARAIAILQREAYLGGRIVHPNVVPILSACFDASPFHLVMPRLSGATADRLLRRQGVPRLANALWLARQLTEGLKAIYATAGMAHGDVCPANVMVAAGGHATLIDLGFARSPSESAEVDNRNAVMGQLRYAAPETLTSTTSVDHRSDFYSLGVTLYELLSGRLPFDDDDPARLAEKHRQDRPAWVRKLARDLPRQVAELVHDLLAKNPSGRPQSHDELIDRLCRLEVEHFCRRSWSA